MEGDMTKISVGYENINYNMTIYCIRTVRCSSQSIRIALVTIIPLKKRRCSPKNVDNLEHNTPNID